MVLSAPSEIVRMMAHDRMRAFIPPLCLWRSLKVKRIHDGYGTTVVLVNCQLVGGAHEGQPGFTLVFAKAVLVHQWVQSVGWVWSQSSCARCSAPRRVQLRPWRLKRRPTCTSIFFSMTPLPHRTVARRRPNERRSGEGMLCQLSIPSRLPRM